MSEKNNDNSIIIIGAGFAGLAAGIYARLNGYDATIFEMHNLPGRAMHFMGKKRLHLRLLHSLAGRILSSKRDARHVGGDRSGPKPKDN